MQITRLNAAIDVALLYVLIAVSQPATAAEYCTTAIITPGWGTIYGGRSVAIDGDWAVAISGGYSDDGIPPTSYVYRRAGASWVFHQQLSAMDGSVGAGYHAAGLRSDYLATSTHIFHRNLSTWTAQDSINVSDTDGTVALAGTAQGLDVYRRTGNTWTLEATLTASIPFPNNSFSGGADVLGDMIVKGARKAFNYSGAVYVFERIDNEWVETQILLNPDPSFGGEFGHDIAISDEYLVIASPPVSIPGLGTTGGAYVFERVGTSWVQQAQLTGPAVSNLYGYGVSISGRQIAISGCCDSSGSSPYVYELNEDGTTWELAHVLSQPPGGSQWYGTAIGISEGTVIVPDATRLYFFAVGQDCNSNNVADACDVLDGTSEDQDQDGRPDECCPDEITVDCNENGVPDECELGADCNGNSSLDECDIADQLSLDDDDNGIPDECCPIPCLPAEPTVEQPAVAKNRFISFGLPTNSFQLSTAIRVEVTVAAPPGQPAGSNFRYVNTNPGLPRRCCDQNISNPTCHATAICQSSADCSGLGEFETCRPHFCSDSDGGWFRCARLGCQPEYRDWSSELAGMILHVSGNSIAPGSTYVVTHVDEACGAAPNADLCPLASGPTLLLTAVWGDIGSSGGGLPDGNRNVIDIGLVINKVKGVAGGFPEARCWLKEQDPSPQNTSVNVVDIGLEIDACKGLPYPYNVAGCP